MVAQLKHPVQRPGRMPPSDWDKLPAERAFVTEYSSCMVDPDFDDEWAPLPLLRNGVIELHPDGLGNYDQSPLVGDTHPFPKEEKPRWRRPIRWQPPEPRPRINKRLLWEVRQERIAKEWATPKLQEDRHWRTPGMPQEIVRTSMQKWWNATDPDRRGNVDLYTSLWFNGLSYMMVPPEVDPNIDSTAWLWVYIGERTAPQN